MIKEKLDFPLPIVVEGKYDKMKLSQVTTAHIVTTGGFGIFNKKEKLCLIKQLAKGGIVIMCDSDGAGSLIRNYIMSAVPADKIYNLYIPQIEGKERRKKEPSKEGTLGVEGMSEELLYDMLYSLRERLELKSAGAPLGENRITKAAFYEDGFAGGQDSGKKREKLAEYFSLPRNMTANALLGALNILTDLDGYRAAVGHLCNNGGKDEQ